MDDNHILGTTVHVADHQPPYLRTVNAIFYGANATSRSFVPVPFALGIKEHAHVDDLATEIWIMRKEAAVIPLSKGRIRISHFPEQEDAALLNDYTIFYENQSDSINPNRLLNSIASRSFWWGDVLVMKHRGKGDEVVDIGEEDVALVDFLVARTWEVEELGDSE